MAYLTVLTVSEGRRAGFAAVAGVALGLLIVGLVSALGVAALIDASPVAYNILRWAGVIYLLWLAAEGWFSAQETSPEKVHNNDTAIKYFKRGLVTNLLNPKAAFFYIVILPQFIDNPSNSIIPALTLSAIYVGIATAVHASIVGLAGMAGIFLQDSRRMLFTRRLLSGSLALIAIWLAYTTGKDFS